MRNIFAGVLALAAALTVIPARASDQATFERDLTVNGRVDLTVATGAGSIHLTPGPAGHVHIFGRVRSGSARFSLFAPSEEDVQQIAAHPPIEQTGNIVRIGAMHQNFTNISIDYEVQAPVDSFLDAGTGSGNVTDDGVGANAKLSTGSGSVHATSLAGPFSLSTGSGSIYAEQAGAGDVKAETGSGSIELKNLSGSLHAHTGSGSIKASGTPTGPWSMETGSGSVELWTGSAGMTLNAHTGSGGIHSDQQIATEGTATHHHLTGKINGGGPMVHIVTGSGSIGIH